MLFLLSIFIIILLSFDNTDNSDIRRYNTIVVVSRIFFCLLSSFKMKFFFGKETNGKIMRTREKTTENYV